MWNSLFVIWIIMQITIIEGDDDYDFDLKFSSLQSCDEENIETENVMICSTELEEVDGNETLNAQLTLKVPLDNTFGFKIKVTFLDESGTSLSMKGSMKDFKGYLPQLWDKLTSDAGVSDELPIPPGQYNVNNFLIPTEDFKFLLSPDDHLLVTTTIVQNSTVVLCRQLNIKAVPK